MSYVELDVVISFDVIDDDTSWRDYYLWHQLNLIHPYTIVLLDAWAVLHRGYHATCRGSLEMVGTNGCYLMADDHDLRLYNEIVQIILLCVSFDFANLHFVTHHTMHTKQVVQNRRRTYGTTKSSLSICERLIHPSVLSRLWGGWCWVRLLISSKQRKDVRNHYRKWRYGYATACWWWKVFVYTPLGMTQRFPFDEKGCYRTLWFYPKMIPDYKGLAGDPSDNIIGIALR